MKHFREARIRHVAGYQTPVCMCIGSSRLGCVIQRAIQNGLQQRDKARFQRSYALGNITKVKRCQNSKAVNHSAHQKIHASSHWSNTLVKEHQCYSPLGPLKLANRYRACNQREPFPASTLSTVSRNLILTGIHWTKTRGLRLTAIWNPVDRCISCRLAERSQKWKTILTSRSRVLPEKLADPPTSQKIFHILRNMKGSHFLKIYFNIILPCLGLKSGLWPSDLSTKICMRLSYLPNAPHLLDLITRIFGEEYRS